MRTIAGFLLGHHGPLNEGVLEFLRRLARKGAGLGNQQKKQTSGVAVVRVSRCQSSLFHHRGPRGPQVVRLDLTWPGHSVLAVCKRSCDKAKAACALGCGQAGSQQSSPKASARSPV